MIIMCARQLYILISTRWLWLTPGKERLIWSLRACVWVHMCACARVSVCAIFKYSIELQQIRCITKACRSTSRGLITCTDVASVGRSGRAVPADRLATGATRVAGGRGPAVPDAHRVPLSPRLLAQRVRPRAGPLSAQRQLAAEPLRRTTDRLPTYVWKCNDIQCRSRCSKCYGPRAFRGPALWQCCLQCYIPLAIFDLRRPPMAYCWS